MSIPNANAFDVINIIPEVQSIHDPKLKTLVSEVLPSVAASEASEQVNKAIATAVWEKALGYMLTFYAPSPDVDNEDYVKTAKTIVDLQIIQKLQALAKLESENILINNSQLDVNAKLLVNQDAILAQKISILNALKDLAPANLQERIKKLKKSYLKEGWNVRDRTAEYSASQTVFNALIQGGQALPPIPTPTVQFEAEFRKEKHQFREEVIIKTIRLIQAALKINKYQGESLTVEARNRLSSLLSEQYKELRQILATRSSLLEQRLNNNEQVRLEIQQGLRLGEKAEDYPVNILTEDISLISRRVAESISEESDVVYENEKQLHLLTQELHQRDLKVALAKLEARQLGIERAPLDPNLSCEKLLERRTARLAIEQERFEIRNSNIDAIIKAEKALKTSLQKQLTHLTTQRQSQETTFIASLEQEINQLRTDKQAMKRHMNETNIIDFKERIFIIQEALSENKSFYSPYRGQTPAQRTELLARLQQQRMALVRLLRLHVNGIQETLQAHLKASGENETAHNLRQRIFNLVHEIGIFGVEHSTKKDFNPTSPLMPREQKALLEQLLKTQNESIGQLDGVIRDLKEQLEELRPPGVPLDTEVPNHTIVFLEGQIESLTRSLTQVNLEKMDTEYEIEKLKRIINRQPRQQIAKESAKKIQEELAALIDQEKNPTDTWKTKLAITAKKWATLDKRFQLIARQGNEKLVEEQTAAALLEAHIRHLEKQADVNLHPVLQKLVFNRRQELEDLKTTIKMTEAANLTHEQVVKKAAENKLKESIQLLKNEQGRGHLRSATTQDILEALLQNQMLLIEKWSPQQAFLQPKLDAARQMHAETQGPSPLRPVEGVRDYLADLELETAKVATPLALLELETALNEELRTDLKEVRTESLEEARAHIEKRRRKQVKARGKLSGADPTWGQKRELAILDAQIKLEETYQQQQDKARDIDILTRRLKVLNAHLPKLAKAEQHTPETLPGLRQQVALELTNRQLEAERLKIQLYELNAENNTLVTQLGILRDTISAKNTLMQNSGTKPTLVKSKYLAMPGPRDKDVQNLLVAHHPAWEVPSWMQFLKSEGPDGQKAYTAFQKELNDDQWRIRQDQAYHQELLNRLQEIRAIPAQRNAQGMVEEATLLVREAQIKTLQKQGNKLDAKVRSARINFHAKMMHRISDETLKRSEMIEKWKAANDIFKGSNLPNDPQIEVNTRKIEAQEAVIAQLNNGFHEQILKYRAIRPSKRHVLEPLMDAKSNGQKFAAVMKMGKDAVYQKKYERPEELEMRQGFAAAGYTFQKGIEQALNTEGENVADLIFNLVHQFVEWADKRPDLAQRLVVDIALSVQMAGQASGNLDALLSGIKVKLYTNATLGEIGRDVWPLPPVTTEEFKFLALADLFRQAPNIIAGTRAAQVGWGNYWNSGVASALLGALKEGIQQKVMNSAIRSFVQDTSPAALRPLNIALSVAQGQSAAAIMAEQRALSTWQLAGNLGQAIRKPKSVRESITRKFKNTYRVLKEARGLNLVGRILTTVVLPTVLVAASVGVVVAAIVSTGGIAGILVALGWAALGLTSAATVPPMFNGIWDYFDPGPLEALNKINAREILSENTEERHKLINQRNDFLNRLVAVKMLPKLEITKPELAEIIAMRKRKPNPINTLRDSFNSELKSALNADQLLKTEPLTPEAVMSTFNRVYAEQDIRGKCLACAASITHHNPALLADRIEELVIEPLFRRNFRELTRTPNLLEDDKRVGTMINWLDHGFQNEFLNVVATYQTPEQYKRDVQQKAQVAREGIANAYGQAHKRLARLPRDQQTNAARHKGAVQLVNTWDSAYPVPEWPS